MLPPAFEYSNTYPSFRKNLEKKGYMWSFAQVLGSIYISPLSIQHFSFTVVIRLRVDNTNKAGDYLRTSKSQHCLLTHSHLRQSSARRNQLSPWQKVSSWAEDTTCDVANFTPAPPKSTSRDWSAEALQVWVSIQHHYDQTKPNLWRMKSNRLVV